MLMSVYVYKDLSGSVVGSSQIHLFTCDMHAALVVAQVVSDYISEVDVAQAAGADVQAEVDARQKRQRAWLARGEATSCKGQSWQAPKRPRLASYTWARYLDNQVCRGLFGLLVIVVGAMLWHDYRSGTH